MKFRPHRGALANSMREAVDVAGLEQLRRHLSASSTDRIELTPYGYDARTGWDTHLVSVNGMPVGFTDGPALPLSSTATEGT